MRLERRANFKNVRCAILSKRGRAAAFTVVKGRHNPQRMSAAACESTCRALPMCQGLAYAQNSRTCQLIGAFKTHKLLAAFEVVPKGVKVRGPPQKVCGKSAVRAQFDPRYHAYLPCRDVGASARSPYGYRDPTGIYAMRDRMGAAQRRASWSAFRGVMALETDDDSGDAIDIDALSLERVLMPSNVACGNVLAGARCSRRA